MCIITLRPMQALPNSAKTVYFVSTQDETKGDVCNGPIYLVTLMMFDLGITLYNLECNLHFRAHNYIWSSSNLEISGQELVLLFLILIHGYRVSEITIIGYVRMVNPDNWGCRLSSFPLIFLCWLLTHPGSNQNTDNSFLVWGIDLATLTGDI